MDVRTIEIRPALRLMIVQVRQPVSPHADLGERAKHRCNDQEHCARYHELILHRESIC